MFVLYMRAPPAAAGAAAAPVVAERFRVHPRRRAGYEMYLKFIIYIYNTYVKYIIRRASRSVSVSVHDVEQVHRRYQTFPCKYISVY